MTAIAAEILRTPFSGKVDERETVHERVTWNSIYHESLDLSLPMMTDAVGALFDPQNDSPQVVEAREALSQLVAAHTLREHLIQGFIRSSHISEHPIHTMAAIQGEAERLASTRLAEVGVDMPVLQTEAVSKWENLLFRQSNGKSTANKRLMEGMASETGLTVVFKLMQGNMIHPRQPLEHWEQTEMTDLFNRVSTAIIRAEEGKLPVKQAVRGLARHLDQFIFAPSENPSYRIDRISNSSEARALRTLRFVDTANAYILLDETHPASGRFGIWIQQRQTPQTLKDVSQYLKSQLEAAFSFYGARDTWQRLSPDAKTALVLLTAHQHDSLTAKTRLLLQDPLLLQTLAVLPVNLRQNFSLWYDAHDCAQQLSSGAAEVADLEKGLVASLWRKVSTPQATPQTVILPTDAETASAHRKHRKEPKPPPWKPLLGLLAVAVLATACAQAVYPVEIDAEVPPTTPQPDSPTPTFKPLPPTVPMYTPTATAFVRPTDTVAPPSTATLEHPPLAVSMYDHIAAITTPQHTIGAVAFKELTWLNGTRPITTSDNQRLATLEQNPQWQSLKTETQQHCTDVSDCQLLAAEYRDGTDVDGEPIFRFAAILGTPDGHFLVSGVNPETGDLLLNEARWLGPLDGFETRIIFDFGATTDETGNLIPDSSHPVMRAVLIKPGTDEIVAYQTLFADGLADWIVTDHAAVFGAENADGTQGLFRDVPQLAFGVRDVNGVLVGNYYRVKEDKSIDWSVGLNANGEAGWQAVNRDGVWMWEETRAINSELTLSGEIEGARQILDVTASVSEADTVIINREKVSGLPFPDIAVTIRWYLHPSIENRDETYPQYAITGAYVNDEFMTKFGVDPLKQFAADMWQDWHLVFQHAEGNIYFENVDPLFGKPRSEVTFTEFLSAVKTGLLPRTYQAYCITSDETVIPDTYVPVDYAEPINIVYKEGTSKYGSTSAIKCTREGEVVFVNSFKAPRSAYELEFAETVGYSNIISAAALFALPQDTLEKGIGPTTHDSTYEHYVQVRDSIFPNGPEDEEFWYTRPIELNVR